MIIACMHLGGAFNLAVPSMHVDRDVHGMCIFASHVLQILSLAVAYNPVVDDIAGKGTPAAASTTLLQVHVCLFQKLLAWG